MQDRAYKVIEEKNNLNNTYDDMSVLNDIIEELKKVNININEGYEDIKEYTNDSEEVITNYKKNKNNIYSRIAALLATLSLFASLGAFTTKKLVKKYQNNIDYPVTTYTFQEGKTPVLSFDYKKSPTELTDKVYIKVYEPFDEYGIRDILTYDVTYLNYDNIEDYFKYDLSEYTSEVKVEEDIKKLSNKVDEKEDVRVVISETIDEELLNESKGYARITPILGAIWIIGIIAIVSFTVECAFGENSYLLYGQFHKLKRKVIEMLEDIKTGKYNSRYSTKELNEEVNKLLDLIRKNEKLNEEFNKIYSENMDKLNDPYILLEKLKEVNEMCDKKAVISETGNALKLSKKLDKINQNN